MSTIARTATGAGPVSAGASCAPTGIAANSTAANKKAARLDPERWRPVRIVILEARAKRKKERLCFIDWFLLKDCRIVDLDGAEGRYP